MATDETQASVVEPDADVSVEDEYDDVTDPDSPSERPQDGKSKRSGLVEWIVVVAVATSDRVLVNKLSYRLHDPRRGDVVVLKRIETNSQERDLIKRVVGLPGETIEYRDCQLFVNNTLINEPYLDPLIVGPNRCGADQPPVLVEPHHVFVMGDNRGGSLDSRDNSVGQVDYGNLIGRAFVVMWPFADWQWL